jgi:alanine dehydrogenase
MNIWVVVIRFRSLSRAPKLITQKMLSLMMPGSVIVDVEIDRGE